MGTEAKDRNTLYLRLPIKITDQHQILELHPKISVVHLPRQKSRRWCTLDFATKADLEEVREALKKVKINGKSIVLKPLKLKIQKIEKRTIGIMKQFLGSPWEEFEAGDELDDLTEGIQANFETAILPLDPNFDIEVLSNPPGYETDDDDDLDNSNLDNNFDDVCDDIDDDSSEGSSYHPDQDYDEAMEADDLIFGVDEDETDSDDDDVMLSNHIDEGEVSPYGILDSPVAADASISSNSDSDWSNLDL
ncbi:unnamed protein product [Ceutorhynchus assimilis]|uniref:RRM domain-containing protein n=1 Tax=Ceutorhynchus assimilis TaxID=467358 RepID=A0A9N9MTK0_9CUCU|nr:unnamed protein product [Ceutorhynchus assimilis]